LVSDGVVETARRHAPRGSAGQRPQMLDGRDDAA